MAKSYLFASLYIAAGVIGWQAYSAITNSDTSVDAIKKAAIIAIPSAISKPFDLRTQTEESTTQSTHEMKLEKYEKELELLRHLPKEALPISITLDAKKEPEKTLLEELPSWSEISEKLKQSIEHSTQKE